MKIESEEDDVSLAPELSLSIDVLKFEQPQSAFVVYKCQHGTYPTGKCFFYKKNNKFNTCFFSLFLKYFEIHGQRL